MWSQPILSGIFDYSVELWVIHASNNIAHNLPEKPASRPHRREPDERQRRRCKLTYGSRDSPAYSFLNVTFIYISIYSISKKEN